MRAIPALALLLLLQDPQQDRLPKHPVREFHYIVDETAPDGETIERVAVIDGREARPAGDGAFDLVRPRAVYYTRPRREGEKSRTLHINAPTGTYDTKSRVMVFSESVKVEADDGSWMTLEALTLDLQKRTFRTEKPFALVKKGAFLRGTGLEADENLGTIVAKRDARMTFVGDPAEHLKDAPPPEGPLSLLSCDGPMTLRELPLSAEGAPKRSRIDAERNVHYERRQPDGPVVITCDRITAVFEDAPDPQGRPEAVEGKAEGNLRVRQGEDLSVEGDIARWNRTPDVLRVDAAKGVRTRMKDSRVRSDHAKVDRPKDLASFVGNVELEGLEKEGAEPMKGRCARFDWRIKLEQGVLHGDPLVHLEQQNRRVTATQIALVGEGLAVLQGQKEIWLREEEMEILATCAGDAVFESETGIATLADDCIVHMPDFTLTCDRVRVRQEGPALDAEGDVRIVRTSGSMTLQSHTVRYAAEEEVLHLRGRPYVVASTPDSVHYWGPTRVHLKTERIEARRGELPMYSIVYQKEETTDGR
ncbi:MAG: LPS export ABC transporter periplasmic protein LptC [Planctomycetota bacterium]|jgi:lipopolysaccharide export system protein LptA